MQLLKVTGFSQDGFTGFQPSRCFLRAHGVNLQAFVSDNRLCSEALTLRMIGPAKSCASVHCTASITGSRPASAEDVVRLAFHSLVDLALFQRLS